MKPPFPLCLHFLLQQGHIFTDFLFDNPSIYLSSADTVMTQHFTHGLYRNTLRKSYRRGESVPYMKSNVFADIKKCSDFIQVFIHLLVTDYRK